MNTFKLEQTEKSLILSFDKNNADDLEEMQEIRQRESNNNDVCCLGDLFESERLIGNGWSVVSADQLGNLSEAPMACENLDITENGDFETHEDTEIYYYDNYQIRHWMDILIEDGSVEFTALTRKAE